jgi:hypothetical protein
MAAATSGKRLTAPRNGRNRHFAFAWRTPGVAMQTPNPPRPGSASRAFALRHRF